MPHVPIFCSDKFLGKSGAGLYGDVMMEIDWSIGKILGALRDNGVEENTLVVFTTDHGHFLGHHGLIAKGAFHYEDLLRLPFLVRYPGQVPAGASSDALQALIDLPETWNCLEWHAEATDKIYGQVSPSGDDALGMIKAKQKDMGFQDYGLDIGNPDLVKYAEAYGARGTRVESVESFRSIVKEALEAGGVWIVDVPIHYDDTAKPILS